MHVKKNVYGSLLGTLMNDKHKTKDHENARKDLEELGIRPELRHDGTGTQPPACAINLTKEEKKELCDFLCTIKVPSGYSSNIRKLVHVTEQKISPHEGS
jgi:hypothetical protein